MRRISPLSFWVRHGVVIRSERAVRNKQINFFSTRSGPEPAYSRAAGFKRVHLEAPFTTTWGGVLPRVALAYETWGRLNEDRSNTVLLTAGLSASSHAASHADNTAPGWWQEFIGPGKALDTNKFFVICFNALGGCYGSTGPSSIDPRTGRRYGLRFPFISVQDIVKSQFQSLEHLGIHHVHAAVGSSFGGMQSICAAAMFPQRVHRLVTISASVISHPVAIALRYAQRRVLVNSFPAYPRRGMQLARALATVTYRSGPEWEERFGNRRYVDPKTPPKLTADFEVEHYIEYQGEKWCDVYDPNSMLILSKAMDHFTMAKAGPDGTPSLTVGKCFRLWRKRRPLGLAPVQMPTLVMGSKSDALFPIAQQREIADVLRCVGNAYVVYYELDTLYGHDTFLIDVNTVGAAVKGHLEHGIA